MFLLNQPPLFLGGVEGGNVKALSYTDEQLTSKYYTVTLLINFFKGGGGVAVGM